MTSLGAKTIPAGELDELDDEALMAEVAAANRAAFAVLTRRHLKSSLTLARRIAGNTHDAEEIVQDCFLQVWRHAPDWRGGTARFTTWLYRVVVNRSISYGRKRRFVPLDEAMEIPSAQPDACAMAEARQMAVRADMAIAALPERQRAALSLCYYQGLTCAEAAEVLQVSVSAMESLLVRARRTLRAQLSIQNHAEDESSS